MAGHVTLGHQAEDATVYFGLDSSMLLNSSTHSSSALGSDGCGIAAPSNTADPLSVWWQQNIPQIDLATGHHAQMKLHQEQQTNSGATALLMPERPRCQQADVQLKQNTCTASLHSVQAHSVPPQAPTGTAQIAAHAAAATGFKDVFVPVLTSHPFTAQDGQSAPPSPRAVQSAQLTAQLAVETAQVAINTAVLLQQKLCGTLPAPCTGANNFTDEPAALINNDCVFPRQQQKQQHAFAAIGVRCRPRRNSCIAAFGNRGSPPPYQCQPPTSRINSLGGIGRLPNRRSSYSIISTSEQQQYAQQVHQMQAAAVIAGKAQLCRSSVGFLPEDPPGTWTLPLQQQQLPAQQLRQPLINTRPRPRRSSYSISLHPTPEQQQQHYSMSHPRRNSWSAHAGAPGPTQKASYDWCAVCDALPGQRRPSFTPPCSTPLPRPGVWPGVVNDSSSNSSVVSASAANQAGAAAAGRFRLPPWADGRMLELLPEEVAEAPSAGLEEATAAGAAALHRATYPEGQCALGVMDTIAPHQLIQMQDLPALMHADRPFRPGVQQHLQQLGSLDKDGMANMLAAKLYPADYQAQQQQQQQQASSGSLSLMHQPFEQEPWHTTCWEQQQPQHLQMRPTADDFIWLSGGDNMRCSGQLPAVPDSAYSSSRRSSFSAQVPPQQAGVSFQQQQLLSCLGPQHACSVSHQQPPQEVWRWRQSSDSAGPSASNSSGSLPQLTLCTNLRKDSSSSSACDYTSQQAPATAATAAGIELDSGANALRTIQQELKHLQHLQSQLAAAAAAAAGTPVAAACAAALHMHEGAMQQAVATEAALGAALGVQVDATAGACLTGSKVTGQQTCQAGIPQPCDSAQFEIRGKSPGTLDSQVFYCTVGSTV